ncbi:MAG TPA: export ABC transporter ATP-binding protein [Pelotomaculum sp.]|nr:export ABC transporter ATP-binding protein [Pelotomaculum sp.]
MLVEVRNLVKRYKGVLAVDNVSFDIAEGEIFGLLGPNGAGKTTAINTIIGLTKLDSGEIKIFGKEFLKHELEIKQDLGVIPQDIAIFEDLTVEENLSYFGKLYGLKGSRLKEQVAETLEFSGLRDKHKHYPKKFSGGMKRRLNIACAIIHRPKLIVMDEPTVGIDPQSRNHILHSIRQLNKQGSTIIYTSHYMEEVEELCSKIVIMDHGKIIAQGTKEELKGMVTIDENVLLELSSVNDTLIDTIKQLQGVKDCTVMGNQVTIISQKRSKNLSMIINCISDSHSEIVSLNVEKPTLETVFLTLTGRTLRD